MGLQALQEGTYTVLVAEIRTTARRPDAADVVLRDVAAQHGGIEVGVTAGGVTLAFRSAAQGVNCAVAMQEAQEPETQLVVGLHAGEFQGGERSGARPAVLAARLATLARGREVLASALVRELAGEDTGLRFGEAHEVRLPGLAGRMTVHEVRWGQHRPQALRVVIADDAALVRDGVAALLRDHGIDVAAAVGDSAELHDAVARHLPDVALVDIRMPPSFTDEGLVAAERIRADFPEVGVLVLSQHLDVRYALRVAEVNPARTGYLLKDRVTDSRVLFEALERIAAGGCVIDEAVAEGLVTRASALARIDELTEREREVLALVAEGRSNRAIAERLVVTLKTVETHIGQILARDEGHDAEVRSWVRASVPELDRELHAAVSRWLADAWPFTVVKYADRA